MAGQRHRAVVVADDDLALTLLCKVNLELDGYRVLEAHSRADVLDLVAAEDVAVVLLDVHLGADDGVQLARDLRAARPALGLVFLTGSAPVLDPGNRDLADAVLPKPFDLDDLMRAVGAVYGSTAFA